MSRLGLSLRLLIQALAFVLLWPLQLLALRLGHRLAARLPMHFHRLFLRLFALRVRVEGRPPAGQPTLVLANHISWLDIPVLASVAPLSFVAKREVAGWPIIGLFARLQQTIFLDRNRRSATAKANAAIARRLARGDIIVLFAEGTSGDGNRLLPFRTAVVGAARAALGEAGLARVNVQPLAITYTRRHGLPLARPDRPAIAWYGDMDLLPHLVALLRGGPIDALVHWGEPIPFEAASNRKHAAAAAEAAVRRLIRAARANT